jgi:predicted protein tyrosine phosphatase
MLTAVDFISLAEFERITPVRDMAAISIGYPGDPRPSVLARYNWRLRLTFLDNEPGDAGVAEQHLFTSGQAVEVTSFIHDLQRDSAPHRLVVHCTVGASRSAGVALAAHALTDCFFPRRAEANYANPHVVALLSRLSGVAIAIPETPEAGYRYLHPSLQV